MAAEMACVCGSYRLSSLVQQADTRLPFWGQKTENAYLF